ELEPLLRQTHRYAELSELWADGGADTEAPLDERIDHLVRAAQLRVEKEGLEGAPWAIARFEEVLALAPNHQTALTQVGNLCFAVRRFERARDAYLALVKSSSDAPVQGAAAYSLGVLYQDHLANPVGASEALEYALRLQPNHRDALLRYARVSVERGLMPAALQAHQQLLQLAVSKAEQLQRYLAIAELYEFGFREPARAAATYVRALEVTEDPEVRLQLLGKAADLHQRTGDLDSYLQVVGKQATTLAETDPRQAAELLLGNARLILEHKQDPRRAIATVEEGLRYSPEHVELTALAAGLYAGTLGQPMKGMELHRRLLQRGAIRVDSVRALRTMWSQMRQTDRAFLAADVLRLLGVANDEEELTYAQHKAANPTESDLELGVSQRTQWLVHPDQRCV
ncbi:MAG: hypothetical protein ACO32I_09150, partial [Candidatus Limnocylindrus sp.]